MKTQRKVPRFDRTLEFEKGEAANAIKIAGRLSWEFFGTLTFKGKEPTPRRAYKAVWDYFNSQAVHFSRPYRELMICLREERGEVGGRLHFHYLLAGVKPSNPNAAKFILENTWKQGFARVRLFENSRGGVEYTLKCLHSDGADDYELAKFGAADRVTLSRSCLRCLEGLERMKANTASRNTVK